MDSSTRRRRRAARTFAAGVGAALLLTGCGFNAQTLQPYTPAHGVNVDVPAGENNRTLKVRNLLVVADDSGSGIVSASIVSPVPDRLVSVSGTPHKMDNTSGAPLSVTTSPVTIQANQLAVLTTPQPAVRVQSTDLKPGLTVDLKLTFASGVEVSAVAPVMSYDTAIYSTVSPSPTPTPTPTPSETPAAPGETATPSPAPTTP